MAEKQKYKCENCGRLFQNPQALKMHERWKTCQNQSSPKQPAEGDNLIKNKDIEPDTFDEGDVVELPSAEETSETLTLDDLDINTTPEPVGDLVCSECGYSKLTGNEESCPQCGEVFE